MSATDLIRQILWATSLVITFPLKVHVSSIFPDFFSTLASRASFARIPVKSSFRKILLSLCLALCSFNTKRALNTSSRIDSLENFTMIGRVCWSHRLSILGPRRWHFTMVWRCSCGLMAIVMFTKFSTAVVTSSVSPGCR